ncbi:MAG: hypothetical protein AAFR37_12120, partial [Cyanobacteria bacterium J06628_3]
SLVRSSIELSQQTVESWNKVWGDVVNPSGALWAGLCNLGTSDLKIVISPKTQYNFCYVTRSLA